MMKHSTKKKPHPFLKWAGGKTQLLGPLVERIPGKFGKYFEPFVGGGALFFELFRQNRIEYGAELSDLNSELMDTYKAIRETTSEVIELLESYPHDKRFFYELRERDPEKLDRPERAARMIYLNKTCFNGLYRVNRKGKFNVPFGSYKKPKYNDPDNLFAVADALKEVVLRDAPFDSVLDSASSGDLVYFDPPYAPLSRTSNFTSYQPGGFDADSQQKLRDVSIDLVRRGAKVIISNSGTQVIRELYEHSEFTIETVGARRSINRDPSRRGVLNELIITA